MDADRGGEILSLVKGNTTGSEKAWFDEHPDVKIVGAVPFYGAAKSPVAYEYYLQCGEVLCGSIYDVFPEADTIEAAIAKFYPGGRALKAYFR